MSVAPSTLHHDKQSVEKTRIIEFLAHLPARPSPYVSMFESRGAWWRLACPTWKHTIDMTFSIEVHSKDLYHLRIDVKNHRQDYKVRHANEERKAWRAVVESHGLYDESACYPHDCLLCQGIPAEKAWVAIRDVLLLASDGCVEGDTESVALAIAINPSLKRIPTDAGEASNSEAKKR